MGVREIPKQYEHTCDGCRAVKITDSSSRPAYWTGLHIIADAYDYQGAAVADGSTKRLLCDECTSVIHKAVNEAFVTRRALAARPANESSSNP
jgi:hypothetical protein